MIATQLSVLHLECEEEISTLQREYLQVETPVFEANAKRVLQEKTRGAKAHQDFELITGTLAVSF